MNPRSPVATLRIPLHATLVLLSVLSGCLGSDDEPVTDAGEEEGLGEGKGSVAGQVYHLDGLEPIRGASVYLVDPQNEPVANGTTDGDGNYLLRNIEPGSYRLLAQAICCREGVAAVTVNADQRLYMNFTLERHPEMKVETPFVDPDGEWEGFISCALAVDTLNPMYPGPCLADQNHNHRKLVFFPPGVRTITAHIEWTPAGSGLGAEEMRFSISNLNAGLLELGIVEGTSPLELQIQNLDFEDPEDRFDAFDADGWVARLQMEPLSDAAAVIYQQSFSVRYHVHYWEPAEATYNVADNPGSGQGEGMGDQPGHSDLPGWLSEEIRGLIESKTQAGEGPNPFQEGENGDCLDYQVLYDVDGVHSPLAVYVDVEAGTGFVTDSSAGWAHIDFFDTDGNWLGYNLGSPAGTVPENAEYGVICVGLTAGYPDVPEPFALWFYMDGFSEF